jgi:DNA-binding MarR family transcriptional regulator
MTENMLSLFTSIVHKLTAQVEEFSFEGKKLGQNLFIIDLISRKPDCTMKDIARILNLSPSTTTRHVDKLVEIGLVNRNIAIDDRRSIVLFLTPKGENVNKRFAKHRMDNLSPILESFSEKEQGILVELMQKVIDEI